MVAIDNSEDSFCWLSKLDKDLKKLAFNELKILWTHGSTGLEGNTFSLGDTAFFLNEGLTIAGKSLREHNEIMGHAHGVSFLSELAEKKDITEADLFILHKIIQTEKVYDSFAPVGKYKVEDNGCYVSGDGERKFHFYPSHEKTPSLMGAWIKSFNHFLKNLNNCDVKTLLRQYAKFYISFVSIHPFADGNGRMSRLLSNLPLLVRGLIPVIIFKEDRRDYINLLSSYQKESSEPTPSDLYTQNQQFEDFFVFIEESWGKSIEPIKPLFKQQEKRNRNRQCSR